MKDVLEIGKKYDFEIISFIPKAHKMILGIKINMKHLFKNLIIAFLIFLAIAGFFALSDNSAEKAEEISLSNLVEEINRENVSIITIKGDKLEIELKDDTKKETTKEKRGLL